MNNLVNRRGWLQSSGVSMASLAGLSLWPLRMLHGTPVEPSWKLGIQSYTFREFKLEKALEYTQALGLQFAEFFQDHIPLKATDEQIAAMRKICIDHSIQPIAYGVQSFTKNHDQNKRVFDFAKKLGVQYLTADPTPDSFDSLEKLVEEYGISIAIHPHGPVGGNRLHRWYSAEVIMQAIKDRHPKIGTCLDTGHLIRCAQLGKPLDPAEQVLAMGARNFGLHLKDHDNAKKRDVILGQGALKLNELFKALKAVQFAGFISIEYEANPKDPRADVAQCIEAWKKTVVS